MPLVAMAVPPITAFHGKYRENQEQIEGTVARFRHSQELAAFQGAFRDVVKEYSRYLPSHLVTFIPPHHAIFLMADYLGTSDAGRSFYHTGEVLSSGGSKIFFTDEPLSQDGVPVLQSDIVPSLEESEEILGLMASLRTNPDRRQYRIPPGFFVFSFTAQWGAGGYDEEPQEMERIIRSDSIAKAFDELQKVFNGIHENCFWGISVKTNGGRSSVRIRKLAFNGQKAHETHELFTNLLGGYQLTV